VATRTKVTVYQAAIEETWWRGSVYDIVLDTADRHLDIAQEFGPVRTALLRDTMDRAMTPGGNLTWRYTIRVNVPYAEYTLRNTGPVIFPSKSVWLWVRPQPFSYYTVRTPRMFVQGYESHNWLEETITPAFIAKHLL
jgi:hypothetical protein